MKKIQNELLILKEKNKAQMQEDHYLKLDDFCDENGTALSNTLRRFLLNL